ncbi:hypothetical protein [Rhodanobacter ginsenosidimutans]|uniref:Uncharacterized protein n=1 Tax=Rhodanobacter ginsenosidimutans TaxID=490571 RepID=A0ABW0JRG7_9GAMM
MGEFIAGPSRSWKQKGSAQSRRVEQHCRAVVSARRRRVVEAGEPASTVEHRLSAR